MPCTAFSLAATGIKVEKLRKINHLIHLDEFDYEEYETSPPKLAPKPIDAADLKPVPQIESDMKDLIERNFSFTARHSKQTNPGFEMNVDSSVCSIVDSPSAGQRLHRYIRNAFPEVASKRQAKIALDNQKVHVNGIPREDSTILKQGDIITLFRTITETRLPSTPISIIYEDAQLAIVQKPAGVTLNCRGTQTFESSLQHFFQHKSEMIPVSISDLSKSVTGLVLVAKNEGIVELLKGMTERGEIHETFVAVVHGSVINTRGVKIGEYALIDVSIDDVAFVTSCKVLSESRSNKSPSGYISTVELSPISGSPTSVQLRAQMLNWGHAVIGASKHTQPHRSCGGKGTFLSSVGIKFTHPTTNEEIDVSVSVPYKFEALHKREQRFFDDRVERSLKEFEGGDGDDGVMHAYTVGEKSFFGRKFKVNDSTMIPRNATESIVEAALAMNPRSILDLGTGSGNILVSILAEKQDCEGIGVDLSEGAILLARNNAKRHKVLQRCEFINADFTDFEGLRKKVGGRTFDVVVCNPPYLTAKLWKEYDLEMEPKGAIVGGATGYEIYEKLAENFQMTEWEMIGTGGVFILEVGHVMMENVKRILSMTFQIERELVDGKGLNRGLVLRSQPKNN